MKVATQSLVLFSVLSRLLHPSLGASSALRGGERKTANAATRVETFTIANSRDGETDLWYPKEWKPINTETKAGYYGCGVVARLSVPEVNLDVDRLVWSIDLNRVCGRTGTFKEQRSCAAATRVYPPRTKIFSTQPCVPKTTSFTAAKSVSQYMD